MALRHQELVEGIKARSDLSRPAEVRRVTVTVLETVARCLDDVHRGELAAALPVPERVAVRWDVGETDRCDPADLTDEIARRSGYPPEQARYLTEAVLSELSDGDPILGEALRAWLPREPESLFTAPKDQARRARPSGADQPRPVSTDELTHALSSLRDWSGDTTRISRTVSLPDERVTPLLNRVQHAQREVNHRADVRRDQDGVTFTLCTKSLDAVTDWDLRLARSIDEAIDAIGSGG